MNKKATFCCHAPLFNFQLKKVRNSEHERANKIVSLHKKASFIHILYKALADWHFALHARSRLHLSRWRTHQIKAGSTICSFITAHNATGAPLGRMGIN
jgi:hypothetical protein